LALGTQEVDSPWQKTLSIFGASQYRIFSIAYTILTARGLDFDSMKLRQWCWWWS